MLNLEITDSELNTLKFLISLGEEKVKAGKLNHFERDIKSLKGKIQNA
jgi:hypothetical protein